MKIVRRLGTLVYAKNTSACMFLLMSSVFLCFFGGKKIRFYHRLLRDSSCLEAKKGKSELVAFISSNRAN